MNKVCIYQKFLFFQEGEDRFLNEQERQAELIRLKLEKRKAERESNFEGAALVLGLAERNQAAREEQYVNMFQSCIFIISFFL